MKSLENAEKDIISKGGSLSQVVGFGITNQRETTLVWDKETGEPLYNAVVWLDTRTKNIVDDFIEKHGQDHLKKLSGLPISTYFSACKVRYVLLIRKYLSFTRNIFSLVEMAL